MSGALPPADGEVLWEPPPDVRDRSRIGRYLAWLAADRGRAFPDYDSLWQWSVDDLDGFWRSVWDFFAVRASAAPTATLTGTSMPDITWFPGARLSYAEHALRRDGGEPAVIARSQTRGPVVLTTDELRDQVARARAGLAAAGVRRGDRVAAYLPNTPEALVAFLATASLGAVWSSCPPEFGTRSVIDRFRQIEPSLLLVVDGYRYGDRAIDRAAEVAAMRAALPTVTTTVVVPYLDADARLDDAVTWDDLLAHDAPLTFEQVPFDHPLYILYSSGTTGLPKPIVHGHGGILLEHLKILALHHDLGPGDRFFWFTTTGWMMWNYLVSALLVDAAVVLFDGDPGHPDLLSLWRLAAETGTTVFGTSAPFLLACRKAGLDPRSVLDLSQLRSVGSTGAPLPADGFRWVYDHVGDDVLLASVSGGTDVCTAFLGGVPLLPVRAGRITCRCLGAAVEALDSDGRPVVGERGELVLTQPMPSMPVGFWGDDDGARLRATYFEDHPGVWRHGDWLVLHADGTTTVEGRSDSTLNRGGVRIGTADFYAVVEELPEVADSLVVHLEDPDGGPGELLLFLQVADGAALDDALQGRIRTVLRSALSPRHVPDGIVAVRAVPRTLSGKKLEVPVKRILTGADPDRAVSRGALANPESLADFEALAASRASRRRQR